MSRRRVCLAAVVAFLAVAGVLGALTATSGGHPTHWRRELLCTYHGVKAWEQLHVHHPAWTSWHLWRASRTCASNGRGY